MCSRPNAPIPMAAAAPFIPFLVRTLVERHLLPLDAATIIACTDNYWLLAIRVFSETTTDLPLFSQADTPAACLFTLIFLFLVKIREPSMRFDISKSSRKAPIKDRVSIDGRIVHVLWVYHNYFPRRGVLFCESH